MKLAALGSNCIDYYLNIENGKAFPGGGPVNMAVYAARLGAHSSYIGPVGTDCYGKLIATAMKEKGVDISHLQIREGATALTEVSLNNGDRVFGDYIEGVMLDYQLGREELDFITQHDIVVCDLWGKVENYLLYIKKLPVKIAFDCATRPEDPSSLFAIPLTDYLFFSSDEDEDAILQKQMREMHKQGPELVIAMRGIQGSLCFDGNNFYQFGIIPSNEVVDTMGAGDSYIAGFLYGLSQQRSITACMQLGAKTASDTISYFGAW